MLPQAISEIANNPERHFRNLVELVHSLQLITLPKLLIPGMPFKLSLFFSIWVAILTVSCAPQEYANPGSNWDYGDLNILSPYDDLIPAGDFIAGYSRYAGSDLQMRFDLLDLTPNQNTDFYVALDTAPGGTTQLPIQGTAEIEWDTLLVLPAFGSPKAYASINLDETPSNSDLIDQIQIRKDLIPRLVRIPWQDNILITVNRAALPQTTKGFNIQAFSTDEDSQIIRDSIGPFSSEALPPQRAPVVLTFWNSFPAYTPAQALRRWDGAHTGPFGERHGLSILLNNIRRFGVPVVLLDLRDPFTLSALDYLGALPLIKELVTKKQLILPDLVPGSPSYPIFPTGLPDWAPAQYIQDLGETSQQFGLNSSPILFSPRQVDELSGGYTLTFAPGGEILQNSHPGSFLPLPAQTPEELQATPDGLPVAIRKRLIDNALQVNFEREKYPLLILGGSLPDSAFADPPSAAATLSYIANHPWIKPLGEDDLRALPGSVSPQLFPGMTTTRSEKSYSPSTTLSILPNPGGKDQNLLYQSAWESALSLYSPLPPEPEELPALRSNYTGQPGITLAAARWADHPQSRLDCQTDPDNDGIPECILASNRQFAVFDSEGGRLVAYYLLLESGIHQIIAPTSQFIVGLGDPSTWILDAGEGADSAGIHGAFADSLPPWEQYNISIIDEQLTFSSPEHGITKKFSLSNTGLHAEYQTPKPTNVQIPIAIDPWRRFSPDWSDAYQCQPIQAGYSCQLRDILTVEIVTDSSISAHFFTDSQMQLEIPEDPNFNYPVGHYLPFPLALLELDSQGDFTVQIRSSP